MDGPVRARPRPSAPSAPVRTSPPVRGPFRTSLTYRCCRSRLIQLTKCTRRALLSAALICFGSDGCLPHGLVLYKPRPVQ
eukprot:5472480-Prymnesium_polylepis.2